MARAVRKVSRVSTKNQKKEGLNKKLIAIISAIVVVLLGVAVGLIVYFATQEEETYVSDKVYFVEPYEIYDGDELVGTVTFVKENYYNIVRQVKDQKINKHVFIFAYDGSAFYADELDEDNYKKEYETLISRVADLQFAIDEAMKADETIDVVLYIVDVNVDNQVNAALMTDAAGLHEDGFGTFYTSYDESTKFEPALFYLYEGEVRKYIDAEKKEVSTNKMSIIMSTSIKKATNYLKSLYE